MWKRLKEERGNVSLIVAGAMVVLLGCLALVADVGTIYMEKQRLYGALDSGALAGIQRIVFGADDAEATADQYVQKNGEQATSIVADAANLKIDLSGQKKVELGFAQVLGYQDANISVQVEAQAGPIVSGTGFVPIGVPDQTFQFGQMYTLSDGAGRGSQGNFGFLDFPGEDNGANNLGKYIANGYDGVISVGQQVDTKPGLNVNKVSGAINSRMQADEAVPSCNSFATAASGCQRILYLPVVNTLDVNGRKPVTIVGFAAFYLEGLVGNGGQQEIQGRFIRSVVPGQMGQGTDYGLYSVKLTH